MIGRPPCTARRVHQPRNLPTAYITSRASDGECAPSHAASARGPNRNHPPAPPQRARPRTVRMLRVTDAPAPACVGSRRSRCSVEGGVHVKVEEGVSSQPARAERVPHSSLLAVLGWVCVHCVTGCTADSSRVDTGGSVHSAVLLLRRGRREHRWRGNQAPSRGCRQQYVQRWAVRTQPLTPP